MDLILNLLMAQGLLGAFDTIYHHELTEALPRRVGARKELSIHALRAVLYGIVFAGIAWLEWRGVWAGVLGILILIEVFLTLWDFVVEDQTRKLPASERVLHTVLAINGGAIFGLFFALEWLDWLHQPSALLAIDYGWKSIALTVFAIGVSVSGLRDALAAWALRDCSATPVQFAQAPRRILITGGTGFIGEPLVQGLLAAGCEVTLFTRDPLRAAYLFQGRVRCVRDWHALSSATVFDAVINLAGAPVATRRWSAQRKKLLIHSRVDITQGLVDWLGRTQHRPSVLVQASAVGFYGAQPANHLLGETAAPAAEFMSVLCQQWEACAAGVDALGMRRVTLRLGLVFGASGGALPMLLPAYRLGFGARLGDGKQAISWIHLDDLLTLIGTALSDPVYSGVYNAVAPEALTQAEFARCVGAVLRRPVWLRVPAWLLNALLGEMARIFIAGQQAVPLRLKQAGFAFRYPTLNTALRQITGAKA